MSSEAPRNDPQRVAALHRLGLLDTEAEERFDRLTRLAAHSAAAPIALLSLIDEDRQWAKSAFGMERPSTPREIAFCSHVILSDAPMVVPDTRLDARFVDKPLVTEDPHIRFYAGNPVHSSDGYRVGSLCVLDFEPRELTQNQLEALSDIAGLIEAEFQRADIATALKRNRLLERRFETIFERSAEGLALVERSGRILLQNEGLNRLLGYPPRTINQGNYLNFVHPDDLERVTSVMASITRSDSVQSERIEIRVMASDGSWRWFEIHVHDLTEDPSVRAVLLSARDITDHLEFAHAQKEANDRLYSAMRTAQSGFIEFDSDGHPVASNELVRRSLGVEEILFEDLQTIAEVLVDSSGIPVVPGRNPLAEAIRGGRQLRNEIFGVRRRRARNGAASNLIGVDRTGDDIRWVSVNTAPLKVGEEERTIMTFHDVTAVRMLEHELAQQHRRYELIFQHASDILAIVDADANVVFWSPATERVLGRPFDDSTSTSLVDHIHPDDRNIVRDAFVKVLKNDWDPHERVVVRATTPNDDWLYLEATASNLLAEPSINGVLITARDVTAREMLTQALAHQAMRDPLTGIFNRRAFGEGLESSLARASRSGDRIALMWLDLNNFKHINDQFGHGVGDAVLVETARRLSSIIRTGDIVGRFGGDEFAVVLDPSSDEEDVRSMAKRVLKLLSEPMSIGELDIVCIPSIGLAISDAETTAESLMARADAAMYEMKRQQGTDVGIG